MDIERYEIENNVNSVYFEFISKGIQGNIVKVVKYTKISDDDEIYNLSFGDKNKTTGDLDDQVITNNGDPDKVLATVASTLFEFFQEFPTSIVYAKGSSLSRARFYQINIAKHIKSIEKDFEVFGELDSEIKRFEKGVNYKAFYVKKN